MGIVIITAMLISFGVFFLGNRTKVPETLVPQHPTKQLNRKIIVKNPIKSLLPGKKPKKKQIPIVTSEEKDKAVNQRDIAKKREYEEQLRAIAQKREEDDVARELARQTEITRRQNAEKETIQESIRQAEAKKRIDKESKKSEESQKKQEEESAKILEKNIQEFDKILADRLVKLKQKRNSGSGSRGIHGSNGSVVIPKAPPKVIHSAKPKPLLMRVANHTIQSPIVISRVLSASVKSVFEKITDEDLLDNWHDITYTMFRLALSPSTRHQFNAVLKKILVSKESIESFIHEPIVSKIDVVPTSQRELLDLIRFILGYSENILFAKLFNWGVDSQLKFDKLINVVNPKNVTAVVIRKAFRINDKINKIGETIHNYLKKFDLHDRDDEGKLLIKGEAANEFVAIEDELEGMFDRIGKGLAEYYDFLRSGYEFSDSFSINEFFGWVEKMRNFYDLVPVDIHLKEGSRAQNAKFGAIQYETYRQLVHLIILHVRVKTDHSLWTISMDEEKHFFLSALPKAIQNNDVGLVANLLDVLKSLGLKTDSLEYLNGQNYLFETVRKDKWRSQYENQISTTCSVLLAFIPHDYIKETKGFAPFEMYLERIKQIKFK